MLSKLLYNKTSYNFALTAALIASIAALIGSVVLSIEALELARNGSAPLPCDLNAVLSCGTVAKHESSRLLGFPNSFIGMMTLPVIMTIIVAMMAHVSFPRWFLITTEAGVLGGLLFAGWMFLMSYVVIQALCPWCLLVDAAMIMIAWGVTRYLVRTKQIGGERIRRFVDHQYDVAGLVAIYILIAAAIITKFGTQLFT